MKKKGFIHLIGIGGAGMTALANLLIEKGEKVSGSDIKDFSLRKMLQKKGIKIFIGHKKENVLKAKEVVVSSAIPFSNPEYQMAKKLKTPIFHRYHYLMKILKDKKIIAISGTHGKSTTTTLISFTLKSLGLKPTVYIGAKSKYFPLSSEWGKGEYAIIETDEHDKSFLLTPSYLPVILNVDNDHLNKKGPYKGKFSLLKKAFRDFEKVSGSGDSVLFLDDPFLFKLSKTSKNNVISFGLKNKNANFTVKNLKFYPYSFSYLSKGDIYLNKKFFSSFKLKLPGKENVLNMLAALAVFQILKLDLKKCLKIIEKFEPIGRRFNVLLKDKNLVIIDDHADHPTEIKATLKMAKLSFPKRKVVLVLEPHRYSRVSLLYNLYAKAIKDCDYLFLLPLDPADEKPLKGISSLKIYEAILKKKIKKEKEIYCLNSDINENFKIIKSKIKKGDVLIFMGPGKISKYPQAFLKYYGS